MYRGSWFVGLFVIALSTSIACSAPPSSDGVVPAGDSASIPVESPAGESAPVAPPPERQAALAWDDQTFSEVVYVLMRDQENHLWYCTGALVAEDRVVTAAHCLEPEKFVSFDVVAPLAPGKPRVRGSRPALFGGDFNIIEEPDVGTLMLDTPVKLPQYAELTDVVERVESGEPLLGATVVRTYQKSEAPPMVSVFLPLSSTVALGYDHGFGTPLFSKGGDSGAPLFLVENGKLTHKLIAVARQPEPDREIDHFTRIDAELLAWYGGAGTH